MEPNVKNPWSDVGNLNDFLYFCCPECPAKDRSMKKFVTHALKQHPNAKNFLKSIGKTVAPIFVYSLYHNCKVNQIKRLNDNL